MSQTQFVGTESGISVKSRYREEQRKDVLRKEYVLNLTHGQDGWLIGSCPELNVITQGKTQGEIERNAIEAIELVLEEISPNDKEFTLKIKSDFSV